MEEERSPPRLTVEKKILLHLHRFQTMEEEFEVPRDLVQDGIAEAVNIRRDNIPRTIKRLKEEDLIFDTLKRIRGLTRKRKAYFLTSDGKDYVDDIEGRITRHPVTLSLLDGSVRTMPLGEVPGFLNVKLPLFDLLDLVSDDSSLKEADVKDSVSLKGETTRAKAPGRFVSVMKDVPMPKRFYGREEELSRIMDWVEEEGSSILSITGIAGIGKTTLAAKAATELEGTMHVFWYRFHKWDSLRNVLFSISRFLEEMGRTGFKGFLDTKQELDMKNFYSLLEGNLSEGRMLLIFDDFQRAADEIVDFFALFREMLFSFEGVKVLIVGRQIIPFYDRSDVLVKGIVKELTLEGLDKNSCRNLLKIEDIDDEMFQKIYSITRGHPLFVQLVLSAKDLRDQKDIKRYIYEEIFKKLDERGSLLLQIASVFRYPAPSSAFFMEEGLDFTVLDKLVESNLIQETSYDEYEAHDLIKEFFYNRLTPGQKLEYHKKAADFYMEVGNDRATVEAMYHLALAGEPVKALKLASNYGEMIISRGHSEQFASVLELLDREVSGKNEYLAMTRLLIGRVQMIMGHWDRALSELKRASAIAEAEDRPLISVMANLNIGSIESRRGNKEVALRRLQKGLKQARKLQDRERVTSALEALGELYSIKGEFEEAKRYFNEALAIAKELEDPSHEAACYTGMGIIYTNEDRPKDAVNQFQMAIEALERTENLLMLSKVKVSLGTVLSSRGDYEGAIKNFEDSIEICTETGDIRQQAYSMAGAAQVYMLKGEVDTAAEYLDEARTIFVELGERFKIATVGIDYGKLLLLKDEPEEALSEFKKSMKVLEEVGSVYHRDRFRKEIKSALERSGHKKEAALYAKAK